MAVDTEELLTVIAGACDSTIDCGNQLNEWHECPYDQELGDGEDQCRCCSNCTFGCFSKSHEAENRKSLGSSDSLTSACATDAHHHRP
jgi:hypothetical protein